MINNKKFKEKKKEKKEEKNLFLKTFFNFCKFQKKEEKKADFRFKSEISSTPDYEEMDQSQCIVK